MARFDFTATRPDRLEALSERGFEVAASLPAIRDGALRDPVELARRLLAIKVLAGWVCMPEAAVSSDRLRAVVEREGLRSVMGARELEMLDTPRDEAPGAWQPTIGWLFEGAWSLAWLFGYPEPPDPFGGMIESERIGEVVVEFLGLDEPLAAWAPAHLARTEAEIADLEDLLYCVHNAARSALLGADAVPEDFDPVLDGGVVHERRKALTWALAPGTSWDETDVST